MAGNYTVKQGDHLSSIAHAAGFSDFRTIWNHPNNLDLRNLRKNPHVLFADDQIFVPDRTVKEEDRPTDMKHKFKKRGSKLQLRLVLEDIYEKPIANAQCLFIIEGDSRDVTSDSDGKIEEEIPANAHNAILLIKDPQTPFFNSQMNIRIGSLDPETELSGQKERLNNLGYNAGDPIRPEDDQFRSAVEEFQCDFGLAVDGDCGPATQAKLLAVHGA
jgi:hypothetical protein